MLGKFSRILVVDDSATMRKIVASMLKNIGYENVHQVGDGNSALSMLCEKRFSLVISDWKMTPVDGLMLFQELRRILPTNPVPFVMMTAHAVKFAVVARGDGGIHYLAKPFTPEQLASKLVLVSTGTAA